jgi:plastocyanin
MSRTQTVAVFTVLLALVLALAFATRQSRAADQGVSVTNFQFSPGNVTIDVGDSVTFSFNGGIHGVQWTGGPPAANSGLMSSGTFVFTPTQAGTYNYICLQHGAGMSGSVTVQGQQQPTSTPTATNTTVPPTAVPSNTPTASPTGTPTPTPAEDDSPTPTPTPAGGAATRTPTGGPAATATSEPTDIPEPTDTPGDDVAATATPIATATVTATPTSAGDGETPTGTPGIPDTAGDDDDGGGPWGILIIAAVVLVALVGLVVAILSLRNRPTAA